MVAIIAQLLEPDIKKVSNQAIFVCSKRALQFREQFPTANSPTKGSPRCREGVDGD
jgi:hypothetical protein